MPSAKIITRFAPSPTGFLHIGGLRTALYSYLFARKNQGTFILRLEDTDRTRLVPGAEEKLQATLNLCGLKYDQYLRQSDRLALYQQAAEKLVQQGKAYYCYCSEQRLEDLRREQAANHLQPRYDGQCRNLTEKKSEPHVIRFKLPESGKANVHDELHGDITVDWSTMDDFVVLKSDGWPTYHLASVYDDHDQAITHVIRGEEWLPSLPKHYALYQAFGYDLPKFVHLPLLLNPDKSKLSKRQGDVAVEDFIDHGYLVQALINYVALLGWNPGDEREFFTLAELVENFDLQRLNHSAAIFDQTKLKWFNAYYIRQAVQEKNQNYSYISEEVKKLLPADSSIDLANLLEVFSSRLETIQQIQADSAFIFTAPEYQPKLLIFRKSNVGATRLGLTTAQKNLAQLKKDQWNKADLENILKQVMAEEKLSFGDIFWPVRVAMSGRESSPSPVELIWLLGQTETLKRLEQALKKLSSMV